MKSLTVITQPRTRVSGAVGGALNAGFTPDVVSDSNGLAVIVWHQDTYIETIYINGSAKRGKWYDGDTVYL